MASHHSMSQSDAARIQSSQAQGSKDMSSGGFSTRAQSAAAHNVNAGKGGSSGGSGGSSATAFGGVSKSGGGASGGAGGSNKGGANKK